MSCLITQITPTSNRPLTLFVGVFRTAVGCCCFCCCDRGFGSWFTKFVLLPVLFKVKEIELEAVCRLAVSDMESLEFRWLESPVVAVSSSKLFQSLKSFFMGGLSFWMVESGDGDVELTRGRFKLEPLKLGAPAYEASSAISVII